MLKQIVLTLVIAGFLALPATAQTQVESQTPNSTSPDAATSAGYQKHHRHHHKRGVLKQYSSDPRVQDLEARQRSEQQACNVSAPAANCVNLKAQQKSERKALEREL